MSSREESVYMAKLAKKAGRKDDVVEFMEKVAKTVTEDLTVEERNLLSVAYKNVFDARTKSCENIDSFTEQKGESRDNSDLVTDYRRKIETELSKICDGILNLLEANLIPAASSDESRVFYLQMKGQYNRYLAELKTGDAREEAVKSALAAYKSAQDISIAHMEPDNPIRMGLNDNFCAFNNEVLNLFGPKSGLANEVINTLPIKHPNEGEDEEPEGGDEGQDEEHEGGDEGQDEEPEGGDEGQDEEPEGGDEGQDEEHEGEDGGDSTGSSPSTSLEVNLSDNGSPTNVLNALGSSSGGSSGGSGEEI